MCRDDGSPRVYDPPWRYEYIHYDSDPAQLYDLANDPWALENLADLPTYAVIADGLAQEVAQRWDSSALRDKVVATQKNRFALNAAMQAGASEHWDYNPPSEASQQYVRNHMDWTVVSECFRFLPVAWHFKLTLKIPPHLSMRGAVLSRFTRLISRLVVASSLRLPLAKLLARRQRLPKFSRCQANIAQRLAPN